MKKNLFLSLIALVYIIIYKIINFETGNIGSATILVCIGVPLFILISILLLTNGLINFYKEGFKIKSLYFLIVIINLFSIILTFEIFLFLLNPFSR